jgi:hypothetical protein
MNLNSLIKNLIKPRFYQRLRLYFFAGKDRQAISPRLQSSQPFMPLPSARRAVVRFCWGLLLAIPAAVFAQTNYYGADGTQYPVIGSLPGDQINPDVVLNSKGGFVVWQDNITDPTGEGISAMQLNSTLSGSGDIFAVNTPTTNNQKNARVTLLNKGGAGFVWQGGTDNAQHIYARFLNANNLWLNTTNVSVSKFNNTFQTSPAIATLTNGNAIVVWSSFDQASSNSLWDVYGQMLTTNGTAIGSNFLINVSTTYNQHSPAVAALNNGGFVVAWASETGATVNQLSASNLLTYGSYPSPVPNVILNERLFSVSSNTIIPLTGEIQVNEDLNPCSSPAIAVASDGSYMVTWCANNLTNSDNSWDIYERSFTNAIGGQSQIVNAYTYGDQYNPQISAIGGNYLIVWTSLGQDGSREGVYGQFLNEGDSLTGNEFLINTTTVGQQMEPAVASDGAQQFLAVWTSFTFSPNGFDLFAQRYVNTSAVLLPTSAPFVWAPFVLSNNIYQPQLVVSWPSVQGLSVSNYDVFVDGATTPMAIVTSNQWTMTAANGLTTNNTHSFALEYQTSAGFLSPISPSSNGTTWSGLNWYGIPYEWMVANFGPHTNSWPMPNQIPSGSQTGSPTTMQLFLTGGIPYEPNTWLEMSLTRSPKGLYLNWNTQPGMTYQVQSTTNFKTWNNFGAPRFEAGTNDSISLVNGPPYYRVQLLQP